MDFFAVLDDEPKDGLKSNTLKSHEVGLIADESQQNDKNKGLNDVEGEDSYTIYQRDLLLGLNTENPVKSKSSDVSYMAGIRKRLQEKKRLEAEKKLSLTESIVETQVLVDNTQPEKVTKTQKILSVTETETETETQTQTQDVNSGTQLIQTNSIEQTQIIQTNSIEQTQMLQTNSINQTQLIQTNNETQTQVIQTNAPLEVTQVIQTAQESDSEDDQLVKNSRKRDIVISGENDHGNDVDDDEEDRPLITQRIKNSVAFNLEDDDEDDENIIPVIQTNKIITQIESENESSDEDEIPIKKRYHNNNLEDTDMEKTVEDTVMSDLFSNDKEDNAQLDNDIADKIQNYNLLSREERIKARSEAHKRAREEKEKLELATTLENTATGTGNTPSMTDAQYVTQFDKKQQEKAKLYQKMKQKEKRERIEQARLIQEAADAIKHFDPPKLTKNKLLEELQPQTSGDVDLTENQEDSTALTSSQKEQGTDEIIDSIIPKTIVKKNNHLNSRAVELGASDGDSSSDDEESSKDKLRLLELKRKLVQKNKLRREHLTRESSLDERIKRHITLQMRKPIKKDKSEDHKMSTEEMVVELLHRDQMKDAKRYERKEHERKRKIKEREMIKKGIFPSHDDDPEFSEYSEEESESEVLDIEKYQTQREVDEEDQRKVQEVEEEEKEHFMTPDIETLDFKTTQTDAFKKLGIAMTQLFEDGTQEANNESMTVAEKFQMMKGDTKGLKKINEVTEESIIDIQDNSNSIMDASSFLAKMVDDRSSFVQSQIEKQPADLNNLLGSQIIELGTQADESTQVDIANGVPQSTSTQIEVIEEDDDEEEEKITVGRKRAVNDDVDDSDVAHGSDEADEEDEEETEEEKNHRIRLMKLAKEQERQLRVEREKKMKEMGLNKIMENEADESEDEFKGIGGEDGEVSDVENSDDEKMIDDAKNIALNATELRQKRLQEELETDKALVEKTFKDIKTHKLRERRAKDGVYDMELSDDDDDEYFKLKMLVREQMERKQNELEVRNKVNLSESNPQKPFFDAMAVELPSRILSFKKEKSSPSVLSELVSDDEGKGESIEDKPIVDNDENKKRSASPPFLAPKRRKIPEPQELDIDSLKQQDLREEARAIVLEELSSDDEDGSSELKRIKSTSTIKLSRANSYKRQSQSSMSQNVVDEDIDTYSMLASRSTSITASFKKATAKKVRKGMFTGNIVREVTVTTNARPVLNSKSAVTKLVAKDNEASRKDILDEAADRMSSMLAASRKKGIRKLGTKFRR